MPLLARALPILVALLALVVGPGCDTRTTAVARTGEAADVVIAPLPDRTQACRMLVGEVSQRVDDCLASVERFWLSTGATDDLESLAKGGKILVIGKALPLDVPQLPLPSSGPIRDAMLGTDEEAAAGALRDAEIRGVVVHRDLDGALDRDATVLSRLARHDFVEWHQLRRVTELAYIYSVRNSPMRLGAGTAERMLSGLRSRLARRAPAPVGWDAERARLIASVRLQGHTLLWRHVVADKSDGLSLERALDLLAAKIVRRWEREVEVLGFGPLHTRLDDARLELHLVMEEADVEPRSPWQLYDIWEMGVDGMLLSQPEGNEDDSFSYMPGSEAVPRAHKSVDAFLRFAAQENGWRHERPWNKDPRTRLRLIRDEHYMEAERGGGRAVRMVRGMPEEDLGDLTDRRIRQMLIDGAEWWLRNMRPDGSINYKYWPEQNRMSDDYNEVRHILAARDLSDAFRYRPDPRYLEGARRAMTWLMQYAVQDIDRPDGGMPHPEPDTMLFRFPSLRDAARWNKLPNQKLGTVAVALLGWVAYAQAAQDHSLDQRIRKMARYVLSQLEPSGRFKPYNVPAGHPYERETNDIVPGEAALALGIVAEYFGEEEWLEFFPKFLDYYEPWWNERAPHTQAGGRWPHETYTDQVRLDLIQFGPWAVMAAKQYYLMTGDERAGRFGLQIADWMIDSYEFTWDRAPFPEFVGGYYKMPTELPAMQSFCYSEGTAAAYHIAARLDPARKARYDDATRQTLRFLAVMQYDDVDSYFAARPKLVHGGIRYAMDQDKVRIDYVGHGLSTVTQYLDARDFDPTVALDFGAPDDEVGEDSEERAGDGPDADDEDYDLSTVEDPEGDSDPE